jgi:S1-C subfamily serine protease
VDYQFNYLVFSDGQTVKIAAPRVVAKIRDLATHRDIALLHVSAKLTEVFTWAGTETIRDRTPVVSVGSSELKVLSEKYASINRVCLAGCITSVKNLSVGGVLLLSNVPTRAGDSGGPIVDADGRLIAIHFGVRTSATTSSKAIAFRPDLSWVSSAIDEDRSRPRPSAEMILPQPAGANDDPVIMISLE